MMVLLGYFIIATMAGVAASAIVGLLLTNIVIARFQKAVRPIRIQSDQSLTEGISVTSSR